MLPKAEELVCELAPEAADEVKEPVWEFVRRAVLKVAIEVRGFVGEPVFEEVKAKEPV